MFHSVEANDLERFKGSINLTEHEPLEWNNKSCSLRSSVSYPPLIKEMKTSKKYGGYDKIWVTLGRILKEAGASCLSGNEKNCENGLKTILEYASGMYPKQKQPWQGGQNKKPSLAKYAVNTYLTSMAVDFLAIYHKQVGLTDAEISSTDQWLRYLVKEYRKPPNNKFRSDYGINAINDAQNHWISSSSAVMSVGSWLGDEKLFSVGLKQWEKTISTIRDDGSLPHEAARGSRAMSYTGLTIGKLMRIAETARQQGIDLYSKEVKGKSIHDAVAFYIRAIENPVVIWKYAKYNKSSGGKISYKKQETKQNSAGIWIFPYVHLFPNHENTKRLLSLSGNESDYSKSVVYYISSNGAKSSEPQWPNRSDCFYPIKK
tara:strand:+ start:354 stop:1475 length:1122 start_codon:yes stop_codon:yes gene_type:complete